MKIGIVGPCAAGKTTLQNNLIRLGYDARAIVQEHSGVQYMWQRITNPEVLVFLDASLATICARRKVNWEQSYIDEQQRRLTHAREHADFFLITDPLTRDQVVERIIEFLNSRGVVPEPR
jgi:deoxyadenosine/deoxycytidine kinase